MLNWLHGGAESGCMRLKCGGYSLICPCASCLDGESFKTRMTLESNNITVGHSWCRFVSEKEAPIGRKERELRCYLSAYIGVFFFVSLERSGLRCGQLHQRVEDRGNQQTYTYQVHVLCLSGGRGKADSYLKCPCTYSDVTWAAITRQGLIKKLSSLFSF